MANTAQTTRDTRMGDAGMGREPDVPFEDVGTPTWDGSVWTWTVKIVDFDGDGVVFGVTADAGTSSNYSLSFG